MQVPTLAGSSGSPVFVRRTLGPMPVQNLDPQTQEVVDTVKGWTYGTVWLLGLLHGGWDVANMSLCIPWPKILDTIDGARKAGLKAARSR